MSISGAGGTSHPIVIWTYLNLSTQLINCLTEIAVSIDNQYSRATRSDQRPPVQQPRIIYGRTREQIEEENSVRAWNQALRDREDARNQSVQTWISSQLIPLEQQQPDDASTYVASDSSWPDSNRPPRLGQADFGTIVLPNEHILRAMEQFTGTGRNYRRVRGRCKLCKKQTHFYCVTCCGDRKPSLCIYGQCAYLFHGIEGPAN